MKTQEETQWLLDWYDAYYSDEYEESEAG